GQGGVSRAHCELVKRDGELKLVDKSRFGTFVNEKRISGEIALQPADVIRIGSPGEQLQVIRMEATGGT
ncbi:MAG: FHA domain-containing protein, partial [Gammaproteobacteria bacterium]|nr:FHA domain-containing protein [Gammaproteobacteria bacterium]